MNTSRFPFRVIASLLAIVILAVLGVFWWKSLPEAALPEPLKPTDLSGLQTVVDRGIPEENRLQFEARILSLQEEISAQETQNIGLELQLGNAYYTIGELGKAVEQYDKILATHPADAPALENKGQTVLEMGDPNGALELWGRAVASSPFEGTYLRMADAIEQNFPERRDALKTLLEDAISTLGQSSVLLTRLGKWYEQEGEIAEAISHYEIAVQLDPDNQELIQTITRLRTPGTP